MASLGRSGFELGDPTMEWGGPGTIVDETTIVRSGGHSAKCANLVSGVARFVAHTFVTSGGGNGPYFKNVYTRVETRPSAENTIMAVMLGAAIVIRITMDSSGLLRLYDEDGAIGSASIAVPLGDFQQRIGIALDRTAAAGSHVVRGYLNEVEFAGATDRSLSTGVDSLRLGGNLNLEAQTQGEWYFDDFAVNDSTGSEDNGMPAPFDGMVHFLPAGAGDAAATLGTFADIDQVPPDDVTHIEIDANGPANYIMTPPANLGLRPDDTILLLQVGTRQRPETAAAAAWRAQLKSQSGGTTASGTSISHNDTTWRTNADTPPRLSSLTSYTDPQGGGPWTYDLLTTLIAGVDVTDANPDMFFAGIWVLVVFVRAPAKQPIVTTQAVQRAANW